MTTSGHLAQPHVPDPRDPASVAAAAPACCGCGEPVLGAAVDVGQDRCRDCGGVAHPQCLHPCDACGERFCLGCLESVNAGPGAGAAVLCRNCFSRVC